MAENERKLYAVKLRYWNDVGQPNERGAVAIDVIQPGDRRTFKLRAASFPVELKPLEDETLLLTASFPNGSTRREDEYNSHGLIVTVPNHSRLMMLPPVNVVVNKSDDDEYPLLVTTEFIEKKKDPSIIPIADTITFEWRESPWYGHIDQFNRYKELLKAKSG